MTEDKLELCEALRRREALLLLGGIGASALFQTARGSSALARTAVGPTASAAASCVLTSEVTEGPYWIANHLTRRDITEQRPGVALVLHLRVEDATTCKPIAGADVEVWHADAHGLYSGFGASSPRTRFLRGHQKTSANGVAVFDTIYPGWYQGRTTHIHIKVHVGGRVVHTGQLFFPDSTSRAVYRTAAYRSHGQPDTTNRADNIYASAGGRTAQLKLTSRSPNPGYTGAITVGIRPG